MPFKDLLRVVEHHGSRVQRERAVRDDAGVVPALALGIIHHEHMVGKLLAKAELRLIGGFCFGAGGALDLDLQHNLLPLSILPAAVSGQPLTKIAFCGYYYSLL